MIKWIISLIWILILLTFGYAFPNTFLIPIDMEIEDRILSIGEGAVCNITIQQNNTIFQQGDMTRVNLSYTWQAGIAGTNLSEGEYVCVIECIETNITYSGGCDFSVIKEDTMIAIVLTNGILILFFSAIGFIALTKGKDQKRQKEEEQLLPL